MRRELAPLAVRFQEDDMVRVHLDALAVGKRWRQCAVLDVALGEPVAFEGDPEAPHGDFGRTPMGEQFTIARIRIIDGLGQEIRRRFARRA
jgi:hypothetical protein